MAQILVTYDTKEKTLTVSQDGNILQNVEGISFSEKYDSDGEFNMAICMCDENENDDMKTVHYMYAKKMQEQKVPEKVLAYLNSFNKTK